MNYSSYYSISGVMKTSIISQTKHKALIERMNQLGIKEEDLRESFIRSSGPGGQKVNKSASCVYLVHVPTGLFVKCQQSRSQTLNRFLARRILFDRIERFRKGHITAERERTEKIRRQKRRRSKKAKEKVLRLKRIQSEKKVFRSKSSISLED
jgi:protein subunit release factor B